MRGDLNAADVGGGFELVAGCDVYEPRRDEIRERSHDLAAFIAQLPQGNFASHTAIVTPSARA